MREILFKAKRIDNGEWVEGYFTMNPNNGNAYITSNVSGCAHPDLVDSSTVCQYTGLTDKNGVKIFEGDNIIHDTKSLIEEKRFDKGTVVFDEQIAQFVRTSKDERGLFEIWKRSGNDYEVIGNIHDKEK